MKARELVYDTFIKPFAGKEYKNIGVELEFPMLNLRCAPVDDELARALLAHMCEHGFWADEYDSDGNPAFLVNADGDALSFDNSYNNFEFAMAYGGSLTALHGRFGKLFHTVQSFLHPQNYTLCGMGTNPFQPYVTSSPVTYPVYSLIAQFLSGFHGGEYHTYTDFPAYLSSVQTHLDVPLRDLPRALTLFASLDFVRALLFSNAPAFPNVPGFEETVCFRDYLWEKSGFGSLRDNVGKVEGRFQTADDIVEAFLGRSMFYRERGGGYDLIQPQTIAQYFAADGREADMDCYLAFHNMEVTRRGTLEVRSDCAQPVADAFAPPAFNLGILYSLEQAEQRLQTFFASLPDSVNSRTDRNAFLRNAVIYHYRLPMEEQAVRSLLVDLVALADAALRKRGMGEERLLAPLFQRAEQITCPAREMKRRIASGERMETVIRDYAAWK